MAASTILFPDTPLQGQSLPDSTLAAAHLERARLALEGGRLEAARESVDEALSVGWGTRFWEPIVRLHRQITLMGRLTAEADSVLEIGRQRALLSVVENLIMEGRLDEARQMAEAIVAATQDFRILTEATSLLDRVHRVQDDGELARWMRARFSPIAEWMVTLVAVLLSVAGVILILALVRSVHWGADRRLQLDFQDQTDLAVSEYITESFTRWAARQTSATSGLLRLEAVVLPDQPIESLRAADNALLKALDDLPPVGGIAPGVLVRTGLAIKRWFLIRPPAIRGWATLRSDEVWIRLSHMPAGEGRPVTVVAGAPASEPLEVRRAAEEVSYKMYYLLGNLEKTTRQAEAAELLRRGVELVGQHAAGVPGTQLEGALKLFAEARLLAPTMYETHLYEGVALDLSERHEEANRRFVFVSQNAEEGLAKRARYNQAASAFRTYTAKGLVKAARLWSQLAEEVNPKNPTPLQALSLAAWANAVAHKPIFQDLELTELVPGSWPVKTSNGGSADVLSQTVKETTQCLMDTIRETEADSDWSDRTRQQLRWAVHNARGNLYLNVAKYLMDEGDSERAGVLLRAEEDFRQCEMILPPGVETLSNLATVLIERGCYSEARDYAARAISLNKNYEYAYLRLAEAWGAEGNSERVVELLNSISFPPRIDALKELFHEHYVRPPE